MTDHIPIPRGPNSEHLPDESPETLAGIASRIEQSMAELFSVGRGEGQVAPDRVKRESQAENSEQQAGSEDRRLYLKILDGWSVQIKSGQPEYCHMREPGQDWFHLLIDGELFLEHDSERLCLNCAMRKGVITEDRLFWQRGLRVRRPPIADHATGSDEQSAE